MTHAAQRSRFSLFVVAGLVALAISVVGSTTAETQETETVDRPLLFQYALFFAPEPLGDTRPEQVAARLVTTEMRGLIHTGTSENSPRGELHVEVVTTDRNNYAVPDEEYLQFKGRGLSREQAQKLQSSSTVLVFDFRILEPEDYEYLRTANALLGKSASETGGFVWDESTREVFSASAWLEARTADSSEANLIANNTSAHGYQLDSGRYRAISLGMEKLGLANLEVREFENAMWQPCGDLIRVLTIALGLQGPQSSKLFFTANETAEIFSLEPTAAHRIDLVPGQRDEGDGIAPILTIDLSTYTGVSIQEKQQRFFEWISPAHESARLATTDDPALAEASELAREQFPAFLERFREGLNPGERLLVKVKLADEFMWVEVREYQAHVLTGRLLNDPIDSDEFNSGDQVSVALNAVYDFSFYEQDGTKIGDFTGAVLEKGPTPERPVPTPQSLELELDEHFELITEGIKIGSVSMVYNPIGHNGDPAYRTVFEMRMFLPTEDGSIEFIEEKEELVFSSQPPYHLLAGTSRSIEGNHKTVRILSKTTSNSTYVLTTTATDEPETTEELMLDLTLGDELGWYFFIQSNPEIGDNATFQTYDLANNELSTETWIIFETVEDPSGDTALTAYECGLTSGNEVLGFMTIRGDGRTLASQIADDVFMQPQSKETALAEPEWVSDFR